MNSYIESSVTGTEYIRARLVEIHNQSGVAPHVAFIEEKITNLGDQTYHRDVGTLRVDYNPSAVIELVNPDTYEPLGMQMTHEQLMLGLFSVYIAAAQMRDGPVAVDPVPEVPLEEVPETPVVEGE